MFDDKSKEGKSELDAAWANETQRFEAIFGEPENSPRPSADDDEFDDIEPLWDPLPGEEDDFADFFNDDIEESGKGDADLDDSYYDDDDFLEPIAAGAVTSAVPANPPKRSGKSAAGKHSAGRVSKREKRRREAKKRLEAMPDHQVKSLKVRKTLFLVLGILVVALVAIGLFATRMFATQASQVVQESSSVSQGAEDGVEETARTSRKTEVPDLVSLFGLTQEEAVEKLGHGATESGFTEQDEEDNPIKKKVSLVLTEEPSDSKSGTPTVYLGLNEDGKVIMAGYSAATASLGYGTLSFSDIVENEHIIEQTLGEAGIKVEEGTVKLPKKESAYQTYDSDGVTLVRESSGFDGTGTADDGSSHSWSGVLTYDYTAANASGNLADTVRQVFIYVYE